MTEDVGLSLAIFSALCWGGLDAMRKKLSIKMNALPLTLWLVIGQWPVFLIWVIQSGKYEIGPDWVLPGASVAVLAVIGALLFMKAVQISDLSLVIPMLSFTPVFAVGSAALVLGEMPSDRQMIGIIVIVLGAFILGRAGAKSGERGFKEPGVWIMIAVAFCWAATLTFDKVALAHASVPMHALCLSLLMGVLLFLTIVLRGASGELKDIAHSRNLYLLAVLTSCLATGAQLVAVTTIKVGVIEAIKRSFGLALSVVNGWLIFGEPPTLIKQISIVVMGCGVLILVL